MSYSNNRQLAILKENALPALSGEHLTYNAAKNVFLTTAYTSMAGNCYYKAIRLSDRICVFYEIGEGYARTFLNGITIFGFDGRKAQIVGRKTYHCNFFDEESAKNESIKILSDYLAGQAKMLGNYIPERELVNFSREIIEETHQKRLA